MCRISVGRILAVVALALLAAVPAHAQGIVVAGGWAESRISNGSSSTTTPIGAMFNVAGPVLPFVKIVGDLGYTRKEGVTLITGTGGVRFGPPTPGLRVSPFVEGLAGLGYLSGAGQGSNAGLTYGLGGGVDIKTVPVINLRLQVNYFRTRQFGTDYSAIRFGVGISAKL